MFALKGLMRALGVANTDCRQDGSKVDPSVRASYLFNTSIAGVEDADALLIIGSNPRWEAPLINARVRKAWLNGKLKVGLIGEQRDLTYGYDYLGAGPETLTDLAAGKHSFLDVLKAAEKPMLILGPGALGRDDGAAVLAAARQLAEDTGMIADEWNGFNVLHGGEPGRRPGYRSCAGGRRARHRRHSGRRGQRFGQDGLSAGRG